MSFGSGPVDLEEAFFAEKNARLLERLREQAERERRRELLREVLKVDENLVDRLLAMDIGPERAMVLRLIPQIFVAWADGSVDEPERKAILDAAANEGVATDGPTRELLDDWLRRKPDAKLLDMWKDYIRELWVRLSPDERVQMRDSLLFSTRVVAEAAGGFLGLASISTAEQKVLDDLESVLE